MRLRSTVPCLIIALAVAMATLPTVAAASYTLSISALKVQHSQPHITPLSRNNSLEHCPRCIIRWIAPVTRDRTENSIRTCGRGNLGQHLPAIQEKTLEPSFGTWSRSNRPNRLRLLKDRIWVQRCRLRPLDTAAN